ncbi:MAG TPA: M20/M25/M40 family metallo-hydrolase [Gemmatimonadales bacterium]|nr:M20/M25/M40 family metallo-hydrolase [Gemmatimonadales bacterium]
MRSMIVRGLALLAVIAGLRAPLAAQTFAADDPALRRIWALGMDSSRAEALAQVLFDSIGPRLTGTALQKGGNDWLVRTYTGWGITARNERAGTWRGWRRGASHIDLVAPRVRTLEGTMLGFSPGTRKKDLTATTVILPRFADSTEFVRWLPQARGQFVLVSAPQPTCRPVENWEKNATPESKVRMDSLRAQVRREWAGPSVRGTGYSLALGTGELGLRLEQAGVAGVITSRPKDAWGTIEIFDTYNTRAPAVALSCEDYGLVYRLTERHQGPKLRLNLDADLLGEQPVFNTVAVIPGTSRAGEYVMLSAHFDSWDGSSGATDNGTGTVVMMEAMRILKQVLPQPSRTILVGHWTSEENGLVGSRAFSEDHPEVREGLQVLLNQDNGTGRIVRLGAAGLPDLARHLEGWLARLPQELRQPITFSGPGFPSGGGSDDASFACWGLPATSLGAHGWDYGNYTWHTNRDTYDKVVFDDLRSTATLAAMLAYMAAEDTATVTRERVDLAALAERARADTTSGPRRPIPTAWPECQAAPRTTKPRLK